MSTLKSNLIEYTGYNPDNYVSNHCVADGRFCARCNKCGSVGNFRACAETSFSEIIIFGLLEVETFGVCNKFEFKESMGGKAPNISLLKRAVLTLSGFEFER